MSLEERSDPGKSTEQDNPSKQKGEQDASGEDPEQDQSGKHSGTSDDTDIEGLLLSGEPKKIEQGIRMVDERYRREIAAFLRSHYPGLDRDELKDVWQETLIDLHRRVMEGKYKRKGCMRGLLEAIASCNAIDHLRRRRRRRRRNSVGLDYSADVDAFVTIRFDDQHDLEDVCTAIWDYFVKAVPDDEQVVMRMFVQLVCLGKATMTGRVRLSLLTDQVNKKMIRSVKRAAGGSSAADSSADEPIRALTRPRVRSLFRSGRKKLQEYLVTKGFFHV